MKTFRLTMAAASMLCALGTANTQAQGDAPPSRADVVAEVLAARAAGTLGVLVGEDSGSFHFAAEVSPGRTRAEVRAQLVAARESGELDAYTGEDSGSFYLARIEAAQAAAWASKRTRREGLIAER